ncbi:MAG: hypothetical protein PVJ52_00665 [Candidatus Woesebacteria bacterium]|jgi:hypothetical protein
MRSEIGHSFSIRVKVENRRKERILKAGVSAVVAAVSFIAAAKEPGVSMAELLTLVSAAALIYNGGMAYGAHERLHNTFEKR